VVGANNNEEGEELHKETEKGRCIKRGCEEGTRLLKRKERSMVVVAPAIFPWMGVKRTELLVYTCVIASRAHPCSYIGPPCPVANGRSSSPLLPNIAATSPQSLAGAHHVARTSKGSRVDAKIQREGATPFQTS
jgi:hypothetical protein